MDDTERFDSPGLPDAELLSQFVLDRTGSAFAELVGRHGPMVLAVCRRSLGNSTDADDAFQATFLVLAMRAASIRDRQSLAAWLWGVARQTAKDMKVADLRRKAREQRWADTKAMRSDAHPDDPELKEILEDEVDRLAPKYRAPVVLCYLEGKPNREAAHLLGLPVGTLAARLRDAREMLRRRLSRKGVGSSADAMDVTLSAALAPAVVPTSLANLTSQGTLLSGTAAVGGSHQAVIVAKKVVASMAYGKAKMVVAWAMATIVLCGGAIAILHHVLSIAPVAIVQPAPAPVRQPAVAQPAVDPQFTWQAPPAVRGPRRPVYNGPPVTGVVHSSDGKPLAGARVLLSTASNIVRLFVDSGTAASENPTTTISSTTDPDGRFQLAPNEPPQTVVVVCPQGIGLASPSSLTANSKIVIQPWGRIDGTARIGARPAARAVVMVNDWDGDGMVEVATRRPVSADAAGHFTFDHVPPGRVTLGIAPLGGAEPEHWYPCDVKSNAATAITLGGNGRPVVGQITSAVACNERQLKLTMMQPERTAGVEQQQNPATDSANSGEPYMTTPAPDGSFRLQDVPPGTYQLSVTYGIREPNNRYLDVVGYIEMKVVVDSASGTGPDSALNLGQIPLAPAARLEVGQTIPDIAGITASGKQMALSALRGKFILLAITRGDGDRLWNDILGTSALYDRFGHDQPFEMVTIRCPATEAETRANAESRSVSWKQINLKSDDAPALPAAYGSSPHPMFLIDPKGVLLAKSLDAQRAYYLIDRLFSHGSKSAANINIQVDYLPNGKASASAPYGTVPAPSNNNAAANADFSIVDGLRRPGANALSCLHDGVLQPNDNDAKHSFYFQGGTFEGRLAIDLQQVLSVAQVNTYSWHRAGRAPQVYLLFASDGSSKDFDPAPKIGTDPTACGWTQIGSVDTRPSTGSPGGRYAVGISARSGPLGNYRYLLFEMFPTETVDAFGHTFYGEINVTAR
jgi:RNA polymerase sigma factor (sigma-70 family)